jgi:hypothetical protein
MPKDLDSQYIHHMHLHTSSTDTGHANRNGTITADIFLLRQSDIGTDAGIVLMNGAKDCGLLQARGQRLDSVLFSQSDNRHITTTLYKLIYSVIPATFHMLCIYKYEVNHGRFLISLTL